jgi:CheY-like chemotaxis protein
MSIPSPLTAGHPLLLVADDDRNSADSLALLLQCALLCEVATAYDGNDALAQAQARRPAAMVLDLDMPGLSGAAVAREVRASYAEPPFLAAVSGNARALRELQGDAAPAFHQTFSKPIEFERLLDFLTVRAGLLSCR